jgi:Uma2 family endonuclease
MHMSHETLPWTLAELHRLPDDGNKYELVRGELFVTPPPTPAHEAMGDVLARLLQPYVEAQRLGRISRPRSVVRIEGSEVEPDLTVRAVPHALPTSWAEMPLPHLVVEIMSPTSRRRDLVAKRSFYSACGVPCYWIVDGEERTIRVVRPGQKDVVADASLLWHPAGASDPLVLDVGAYFREALG